MINLTTTPPPSDESKPAVDPKNIFAAPIAPKVAKDAKEAHTETLHKRNAVKAYANFAFAAIAIVAYSVTFLYPQTIAFLDAPETIAATEESIENYEDVLLPTLKTERDLHKSAYDEDFQVIEGALDKVFPDSIDKLGIVKRLEDFASSINAKTPPFEFNAITFGEPEVTDSFTIVPISTSIHSSKINFDRFVQLVNLSGRLDTDVLIRLMEISNISIRLRGVDERTGEDRGVDFTVKLNAYSR